MYQNILIHMHKELGLLVDILNEIFSILTTAFLLFFLFSPESVNSKMFVRAVQYQSPLLRLHAKMSNKY